MFRYRREMYALNLKYVYTALLILTILDFNEAIANGKTRRRYGPATAASSSKTAVSDVTEKSKADQAVAASSHTEASEYRRGGAYSTDAGDYSYNNADINLIRPESKPLHTKITAKYTSSISIPADSLEDTETAEEYVQKAMGMYGSRLREPIRIPSESEVTPAAPELQAQAALQQTQSHHHTRHYAATSQQQHEQIQHQQQQQQQQQLQHEHIQQQQHSHASLQQHQQEQDHNLQNIHEHVEKPEHYEYYSFSHKDAQRPQAHSPAEEPEPQGPSEQYQYISQAQAAENEAAKVMLEAQIQAQYQEQLQQAQYGAAAEQQEQEQQQQSQPQAEQGNAEAESNAAAAVYDKDPVTRSYNIYEDHTEAYEGAPSHVERNYRTKYLYKPVSSSYHTAMNENEEKIRVSASTEIPKAEIMKQIEKSVIRYMKELEAEGKIIASPKNQEPKTYFKVVTVPGSEEKRIASGSKSKYSSSSNNYGENYKHSIVHAPSSSGSSSGPSSHSAGPGKYNKKAENNNAYVLENESTYQNQGHEVTDVLTPNVEFIYKIKTKAPLHTATVKTVSKPYSLNLKPSFEQFDHSTALKNLEDFDLTHVVTTPDPEEHQSISSASSNKPSKLYFNSEIYHDINSMPYKQQKQQRGEGEYRPEYRKKSASQQEPHPDYKGYSTATSGYYAEPPTAEGDGDIPSSGMSEDGYPSIMAPYQQFILKKEPSGKYEEAASSYEQPRNHKYKGLDFDSYNPKYNNNPESYGYQQTYKTHLTRSHAPGKRGKRGGAPHPGQNKKSHRNSNMKEFEANIALRPPPKV
ncbi:uncharacterized protein [Musca autumnalis]|uniref:uncharacterized protein n=1 Tax=Musca autumnalis TaxID=221902 RepID=UPI003CF303DE